MILARRMMLTMKKNSHQGLLQIRSFLVLLLSLSFVPDALSKSTFDFLEPEYEVGAIYTENPNQLPKRIAVLPPRNLEKEEDASDTIRTLVYNHFSALSYKDMELTLVDRSLQQALDIESTDLHQLSHQQLKSILKVDGVIKITIHDYETVFALFASTVTVKVSLQLVDLNTGDVIWKGKQTGRSVDGGIPLDLLSAAAAIFSSSQNTGETIKQRVANEVIFELIEKLPDLPNSLAFKQPKIRFMEHSGISGPKKAGDVFQVVMKAEPGLDAFFTIDGWVREQVMQEIDKGLYQSQVQVPDQLNLKRANMSVRVVDESGNQGQLFDYLGGVTIDNIPPPIPYLEDVSHADSKVKFTWKVSSESDIERYQIYRSVKPLSGFEVIKETEFTHYEDQSLTNNQDYYYKLAAVDAAGNMSDLSTRFIGHPVRKGPTDIKPQSLTGKVKWYAAASPYVIEGKLVIGAEAKLVIEPGTRILMKEGARIAIEGEVHWKGTQQKPIRIERDKKGAAWVGILLNKSHMNNQLAYIHISGSKHGLVLSDSRLMLQHGWIKRNMTGMQVLNTQQVTIENTTIEQNSKGLVFKHSHGDVKGSIIRDNKLLGVYIQNSRPIFERNQLSNNQGFDFFIKNADGNQLNLNQQYWGRPAKIDILDKIWGDVLLNNYSNRKGKTKRFESFDWNYQLSESQNKMSPQQLMKQGIEHYNAGRLNMAYAMFIKYSKQKIDSNVLSRLAQIAFLRQRYQRAIDFIEPIIQLDNEKSAMALLKSKSQWLLNKRQEAKDTLANAVANSITPSSQLMLAFQLLEK
jgi:hypothetical protein